MLLCECIAQAEEKGVAIGHFNISNIEGFWAVVNASKKLNLPVIIGVSEGERDFIGVKQIKVLVDTIKAEGQPVFLNADHTYSPDRAKQAIDCGYDAVIIDETDKSFDQNVVIVKEVVSYARSKNPEILIEAELGFIGKSSKVLEEVPDGIEIVSVEEAIKFVEETGVDLFAPAVGNVHGMLKGGLEPKLNVQRIKEIKEATKLPLVLHGASGNKDDEIKEAIKAGISIIHISTELRVAFKKGLQRSLSENVDEIAPYKYLRLAREEMQEVVEKKLFLFNQK
ncbi:MAG TPA: ketose-bisphosphate aldolase [Candidatus Paceibacterota bacterium]